MSERAGNLPGIEPMGTLSPHRVSRMERREKEPKDHSFENYMDKVRFVDTCLFRAVAGRRLS